MQRTHAQHRSYSSLSQVNQNQVIILKKGSAGRVWPYLPDDNNTSNCILVSPLPLDLREAMVAQW